MHSEVRTYTPYALVNTLKLLVFLDAYALKQILTHPQIEGVLLLEQTLFAGLVSLQVYRKYNLEEPMSQVCRFQVKTLDLSWVS